MSRTLRLTLAAAVAVTTFAFAPGAHAQEQILCRGSRYIYTNDMVIEYPYFYVCR